LVPSGLLSVAAVHLFFAVMFDDQVCACGGVAYVVLGIAARWVRIPAAAIGLILYVALLVYSGFRGTDVLVSGLAFEIPVSILLGLTLVFALRGQARLTGAQRVRF
jgi:hypothetical protein